RGRLRGGGVDRHQLVEAGAVTGAPLVVLVTEQLRAGEAGVAKGVQHPVAGIAVVGDVGAIDEQEVARRAVGGRPQRPFAVEVAPAQARRVRGAPWAAAFVRGDIARGEELTGDGVDTKLEIVRLVAVAGAFVRLAFAAGGKTRAHRVVAAPVFRIGA